jgi:hypothetical protein
LTDPTDAEVLATHEAAEWRELARDLALEVHALRQAKIVREGCHPSYLRNLDSLIERAREKRLLP